MPVQTYCLPLSMAAALPAAIFMALSLVLAQSASAMCEVSPVAVDDEIHPPQQLLVLVDPLANDSDPQGLPLELTVDSSTCPGSAAVEDGLIVLTLSTQLNSPCQMTYSADNGQTTAATATITVHPNPGIFHDSFELGNTSAWDEVDS